MYLNPNIKSVLQGLFWSPVKPALILMYLSCAEYIGHLPPELPLLCFPISACKLRTLFSFPLLKTKLCPFTNIITLYLTMCIWKCRPPCFRHLGLKPDDVGLARCLLLICRHHEVPSQTCPCFCDTGRRVLPSPSYGSTGLATTQLPAASAKRSRVSLSPRLGMRVYPVHFVQYCLCTQDKIAPDRWPGVQEA